MNMIKFLMTNFLLITLLGCGDMDRKKSTPFAIEIDGKEFRKNERIAVSIKNPENKEISNIKYSIDGKELLLVDGKIILDITQLGTKMLNAKVDHDGTSTTLSKKIKVLAEKAPEVYTYEILNEYPHDNRAYTQGLEFHNGVLYESTGKKDRSSLRKVDYNTGEVLQQVDMDGTVFGEGITIFNDKIYMLTWQSGLGFIYNLNDLKKLDNFQYGESKEGWGLTNNGEKLIKSDGTEKIWFLNPETLVEEGYIETVTNKSIFNRANELEYVDGKIYANVYQRPSVMIIDAISGAIEGVVNFSGLDKKVSKHAGWSSTENVLNGIAYHPERKTFFVTGKDWDKLFEVKIVKKQ
ncbi:glutaminyl-peptide cyclotransferase [Flavobacteriaceae bacterium TP-CH-4]|uniref:Glutaminyl-peptide cyclotransferase n=2 Tax=Pelagihabitans pacificus TaxID=2696054 RepID=A0A967ATS8_9FLAO|nr:glutaminyl-peptide cyclotransferase [Pelagihabitans pacificus]